MDKHDLLLIVFAVPVILVIISCVLPVPGQDHPLVMNGEVWLWLMALWTTCWAVGFIVADYRRQHN